MTQKKAVKPASAKTKAKVQAPAADPINNESDIDAGLNDDDEDFDEEEDIDDEDDFDASEGSGGTPEGKDQDPEPPKAPEAPKGAKKGTQKKAGKTDPGNYEEWKVEITHGNVDKVKKLRDNVKISEFEAEALNQGALGQMNASHHVMYFSPE